MAKYAFVVIIPYVLILQYISIESSESDCNSKVEVKNQSECFDIFDFADNSLDLNATSDDETKCCFFKSHLNFIPSFCRVDFVSNNGSILNDSDKLYTEICLPYNATQDRIDNLENYSEPLTPCALGEDIQGFSDCAEHGNSSHFCCHMGGYISGFVVNQCYYFNSSIGRAGNYSVQGLDIKCRSEFLAVAKINLFILLLVFLMG